MKAKFNGILTLLIALSVQFVFAQKTVSGTVSDESGPLPGASVMIKGTKIGTETDFDGKYSLQAKQGDVLVFSYVGMETVQKTVGTANVIDVVLISAKDNTLDEVVITGVAGATSRNKLSVTVNKVSEKELEFVPTTSAESVLQGKVAGVTVTNFGQPGQGASIQLRGATNFFGSQEPLVLVDGVIVEDGLQDVNSDDIKSIEIVKGASASALYGSKAGNGVIVITTKQGRQGKVDVTFKSEMGFNVINNFVKTNNSHQYILANDWQNYEGKYTKYSGVTYPSNYDGVDYSQVSGTRVEEFNHYADNPYGVYFNPQEQFFRTGTTYNLYSSVSTGTEKSNLFFSVEKMNTEGVLKETKGYERIGARLNAEFKINNWLTFTANNNIIRSFDNSPGGTGDIFFDLLVSQPDSDLMASNPNGQPYIYVPSRWYNTSTNPIYPLWANPELDKTNKFLGSYKLNFELADWVNLDAEYSLEAFNANFSDFNSNKMLRSGGTQSDLFAKEQIGDYYLFNRKNTSQKAQFTFNFKKTLGDLNLTSKLSYLLEDSKYEDFYGYGSDQLYPNVISLDNYANAYIGSDDSDVSAQNVFGILGLDYKDRYIVDAMYRIDGSSSFGINERWNDYYRVSAAYRISKDLNIENLNELKMHAAYGTAGQRPGYSWQYNHVSLVNGNLSGSNIMDNPDLKPSKTTELEFGLSGKIFDKLTFEAVYSKAKTDDQFILDELFSPIYAPFTQQWKNSGSLDFNTLELSLGANLFNKENFKWDANLVFDTSSNKVTKLNVAPRTVGPNSDTSTNYAGQIFRLEEGVEFGTMWGYQFVTSLEQMAAQLPTGESIEDYVVNRDGVVVKANTIGTVSEAPIHLVDADGVKVLGDIGNANADFKLGFRNNLTYKNLGLYFLIDWKQGGDIYNRNAQWLTRDNRHAMIDQAAYPDAEKKTVDYYQALYAVNEDNKFWVEDGTFVKLREVSLFYTLDDNKLSSVANGFFDSIRIGLTGTNLLTLTNYSGWDPEVQLYDSNTLQYYAVDQNSYPISSSYKLSVTFKF